MDIARQISSVRRDAGKLFGAVIGVVLLDCHNRRFPLEPQRRESNAARCGQTPSSAVPCCARSEAWVR